MRCWRLELVDRLEALAATGRDRVTLVGHSRGGQVAKVAARRRPDLVDGLITLGSPLTDPWGMHLSVKLLIATMSGSGTAGWTSAAAATPSARSGPARPGSSRISTATSPDDVQFTSIYSRRDGIVQWRTCLDPHARHVEVRCSHLEMALDPAVTSDVLRSLTHTATGLAT